MGDDYIRLIPVDKNWQPAPAAAASAEAYVAGLFSAPGDDVWEVSSEFYDQVTLTDAGGLTTQTACPLCGGDVTEWGFGLLAEYRESIGARDAAVPCCSGSSVSTHPRTATSAITKPTSGLRLSTGGCTDGRGVLFYG